MRKIFRRHSLSNKLILLFIIIAFCFLFFVGAGIKNTVKRLYEKTAKPHIALYLDYLREDIGVPPNFNKAGELADRLDIEIVIASDGSYWSSNNNKYEINNIETHIHKVNKGITYGGAKIGDEHFMIMKTSDITYLFNTTKLTKERQGPSIFKPLIFLLLILIVLYFATKRLFAPITDIQAGVKRFGSGKLDQAIDIKRRDELGELADDINLMANDIKKMLDAKRELLLAVSHELRTPLTRSHVALELLDNGPYQQQIKDDLDEMEMLIAYILESERLSSEHQSLDLTTRHINKVITETLDEHFAAQDITLELLNPDITLELDANRIKLLLKSLLENALRYKKKEVAIVVKNLGTEIQMDIIDDGDGIEASEIDNIRQAFYRPDASRQRKTGAYGLGLYLADAIVNAHRGSLHIESMPNEGTTVSVRLPIGAYSK